MKFEKINIIPILIGFFVIEPIFACINEVYGTLIYSILLFLYFLYEFKKQNVTMNDIRKMFPSFKEVIKYLLLTICLFIISISCVQLIYYFIYLIGGVEVAESMYTDSFSGYPLWFSFIYVVIIAPIIEELIFRGVILNKLGKKYNIYVGVFINSIIFSILHDDVIGAFIFGFVLSIIYAKTKSIIGPIIIHFSNNLMAMLPTLLLLALPEDITNESTVEILSKVECFDNIRLFFITFIIASIPILIYILNNWHFLKSITYNQTCLDDLNLSCDIENSLDDLNSSYDYDTSTNETS